jgi:5-methylcytosine-specific restriction endonuclease McrA
MISERLKKRDVEKLWLLLMQNGRCILCGEPIFTDLPVHTYGAPSVEHKIPINKGGAAWLRNLALSHDECNKWRGDRTVMKCVRPPKPSPPERGSRRPLVPVPGIWYSHFRLPVEDPRWEKPR